MRAFKSENLGHGRHIYTLYVTHSVIRSEYCREILLIRSGAEVSMYDLDTSKLRKPERTYGADPRMSISLIEITQSGRNIFVTSSVQGQFQLSMLTFEARYALKWETLAMHGPRVRSRYRLALHSAGDLIIAYGGRHVSTGKTNAAVICDMDSKKIVEVLPRGAGNFLSEGPWPGATRCRGSVVSGEKLIVFTWTEHEDMVEMEIIRE